MMTPAKCLICGADWSGGAARPDEYLEPGKRVFFECGASLSYRMQNPGVYQILTKNCERDY